MKNRMKGAYVFKEMVGNCRQQKREVEKIEVPFPGFAHLDLD